MSTTRRTASSNRAVANLKWRVSPRSAAAMTMPQRSRTAAELSNDSASANSLLVEGAALRKAELLTIRGSGGCEITGRLLRRDLDCGIERHQRVRNGDLLHYLDALGLQRIVLQIRHRDPAVDAADPEPMKDIRHQLLKAHVLHAG